MISLSQKSMAKKNNSWGSDVMGELSDSQFFSKKSEKEPKAPQVEVKPEVQLESKPEPKPEPKSTPALVANVEESAPRNVAPKKSTETISRAMYITDDQDKKLSRIEKKIASRMKTRPIGKSLGKSAIVRFLIDQAVESDELFSQIEEAIIEEIVAKMRG